ncbi:hypothetical protein A7P95_09890 [Eikenella longinqua]|uniref:Uncharacterized protein n=1 Tax=Eikenella longinqua TaxID=1795827 RepID=A0A1A9RVJ8_9NEIS|nr:hypothetical protein A7P95_09890 [Eikenella longinqua]
MRMVNRVHHYTTNRRANASPTISTGFTNFFQALLFIANFANGSPTIDMDLTNLTRTQANLSINPFFSQQNSRSPSRTCNLCTFTRFHFDAMYSSTYRNITDGQSITCFNRRLRTRNQYCTCFHITWRNNITALTICIAEQSNERSSIRIIFDTLNLSRDTIFITLKIHDTIMMLMATTLMASSDVSIVITASNRIFLF